MTKRSDILHTLRAEITSGTSSSIDASEFDEAVIYLNVTTVSGTSPTFDAKIQTSDDGSDWYDIENGSFAQIIAPTKALAKKITGLGRYIRMTWTIGGISPSVTFFTKIYLKK